MSLVIGDTPEQLGSCLTADAVMIDGKIITKQQVAELMAQVEMHRNAEIMWEKTMMQAVGEDGPGDVVKAIDEIKAERDELAAMLVVLRDGYRVLCDIGLRDVLDAAFDNDAPERRLRELQAQAVDEAAHHFVENGGADVVELQEYAESIRKGAAA